jgi:hypothetical protein
MWMKVRTRMTGIRIEKGQGSLRDISEEGNII